MRRRDFLALTGGAATTLVSAPALAQQSRKMPKVGVLWHAASQEAEGAYFTALIQGFRDYGYVEGRSITFEHRYANEEPRLFQAQAAELAASEVDVLIASVRPAALAAQRATTAIPVVFVVVPDPVESKLVASLAKPGANLTGLSNMSTELGAKRLEIIKEAVVGLSRIALLVNTNDPAMASRFVEENRIAAAALNIDLVPIEVKVVEDLEPAFATAAAQRADAVVPVMDPMMFNNRERLAKIALTHRLPTMVVNSDMVDAGALMSFGPSHAMLFRQSARFVDKILKGERPGDIPVEQPTHFELRINLKTAAAIGLKLPGSILARADKVVE